MSRLRTLISSALIVVGLTGAAHANDDLVLVFAGCAGRMSAEMEHAWLVNDARADTWQTQRQRFVGILQAIMPRDRARETLSHRVEAKLAHSAILTTAKFGTDPRRSRLAKKQARIQVQSCQAMLLDG
ncbi:hypothetical protein [Tateyamaria sp.]|uniref:hypothetical protein n=1 Tax=Tateyamaria sp. TaxID=1929288 RepID=UPI00329EC73C